MVLIVWATPQLLRIDQHMQVIFLGRSKFYYNVLGLSKRAFSQKSLV